MLRTLVLLSACLCSATALAETVVPLKIGETEVRFAVDDDFVRTSEKLPTTYALTAAALPPGNRLVEAFISEADAKRLVLQQPIQDAMLQVQVLRNAEALDFSAADWAQMQPAVAKSMGAVDLDAAAHALEDDANTRISAAAGAKVAVSFGAIGKPSLYVDHGPALRFVALIPLTMTANGKPEPMLLECAGAITTLKGKLVYLYAYRNHEEGEDTTMVRAALDRFVEHTLAANAVSRQ